MSSGDAVVKGIDKLAGTRKVKQISTSVVKERCIVVALCWDGSMWRKEIMYTGPNPRWSEWFKFRDIPA